MLQVVQRRHPRRPNGGQSDRKRVVNDVCAGERPARRARPESRGRQPQQLRGTPRAATAVDCCPDRGERIRCSRVHENHEIVRAVQRANQLTHVNLAAARRARKVRQQGHRDPHPGDPTAGLPFSRCAKSLPDTRGLAAAAPPGARRVPSRRRHRRRRPGRLLPRRAAHRRGLRGLRHRATRYRPLRPAHPPAAERRVARCRPARSRVTCRRAPYVAPGRGLQPRFTFVRAALLGRAGAHRRVRRRGCHVASRSDPRGRSDDPLLPGFLERDLRRAAGVAADRGDAAVSTHAVWRRKAYAHFITRSYRRRYGLFACSGILYNHESRGDRWTSCRARSHMALRRFRQDWSTG